MKILRLHQSETVEALETASEGDRTLTDRFR